MVLLGLMRHILWDPQEMNQLFQKHWGCIQWITHWKAPRYPERDNVSSSPRKLLMFSQGVMHTHRKCGQLHKRGRSRLCINSAPWLRTLPVTIRSEGGENGSLILASSSLFPVLIGNTGILFACFLHFNPPNSSLPSSVLGIFRAPCAVSSHQSPTVNYIAGKVGNVFMGFSEL